MADCSPVLSVDMYLGLDKDMSGTLSKQELKEYADGTLTEIIIERGMDKNFRIHPTTAYSFT